MHYDLEGPTSILLITTGDQAQILKTFIYDTLTIVEKDMWAQIKILKEHVEQDMKE
jgi:hypothetical protein